MSNTANQNPPQGARAIPPRPVPDYDSERRKHLEEHEGIARRIYSDPKGIPSMGLGHALAIQKGDGSYALRSLDDIGKEISGDENRPYKFSKEEEKRLRDVEGLLNGKMPDPDPEKYGKDKAYTAQYDETKRLVESNIKTRQAEIKKIIPPYAKQDETPDKNKFGFTLRDDRIQALSEKAWKEHQDNVWTLVEAEAKRRGWSKDEIDSYKNAFKGSWEEMMLASLRFNNVRSPEAIKALLDGDRAKFRAEIEFRSNKETEENEDVRRGLARRRRDEAEKAAPLKSLGEAEQKLWAALVAEYWAYRKEFADLYGLGTPHLVQPGETLESIAKKNGCTVDELKELNGIEDLTGKVGKTIFIPTDAYRTEKAARQKTAAGPSPEAEKLLAMMGAPQSIIHPSGTTCAGAALRRGQERAEARSGDYGRGSRRRHAAKKPGPSGCLAADVHCVAPLARCPRIALRAAPVGPSRRKATQVNPFGRNMLWPKRRRKSC